MLQKITGLPSHVLGIHAIGEVNKNDMENVLLPLLDELAGRTGKLNYLLVLETGVQNFTLAAWWKDMIAGLKHYTQWHRIAVVSDQKAVEWFTDIFQLVIPGRSKGFPLAELTKATVWIAEEDN